MEHIQNDHEDYPNQQMKSPKLCNEMRHPVSSFMESQWKLRQLSDQNFPMEEKLFLEQMLASRNKSQIAG